jgi:tripartite-type tricarboxylate transporter receptor subunit TctC
LTNLQHAAALPDIPTGREAGYKSLEFDGLVGLLGPRNMPLAVRDRIAADIRTIAAEPEVIARLSRSSIRDHPPAEFAAALADQRAAVAAIGEILGIKPAQ